MATINQPKLGLVGETGHSQDILAVLESNSSESEIEYDQDTYERSEIDEVLEGYIPLSDYDDFAIRRDETENDEPEDLSSRTVIQPALTQRSILAYASSSLRVDQDPDHVKNQMKMDNHFAKTTRSRYAQGRPKDPIRDEFIETQSGKKAQCPDCELEVTNRVDVMKNHRNACRARKRRLALKTNQEASAPAKASEPSSQPTSGCTLSQGSIVEESPHSSPIRPVSQTSNPPSSQASVPESTASAPYEPSENRKRKYENWDEATESKKPLRKFFDKLTASETRDIDLQLGKVVFGCNLPFAVVENPEMKELLRKLRPAYKPPNRKMIGNEILEDVYTDVKERLTCAISDKEVTLVQDGWGTSQTQPVIAHSVHSGSTAYFLNAVAPGAATKDAEYCLDILTSAIDECQNTHKCKVIGVVTDNCSVMISLRNKLTEQRRGIFVFGCNAHYLNLIGQKIIPPERIDGIVKVQKYFKNHHFQSAALSAAKGKRPVIPGATRWNSQIDFIENYIENHAIYLDLLRKNPRMFDKSITELINNFSLYTTAEKLKCLAKPVAVALDKVQSNSASLSDAVSEWIKLRNASLFADEYCSKYFEKKLKEALNETALSAYILDPRFRGAGLNPDEKNRAYLWMDNLNDELTLLAMDLEAKSEDTFPKYLLKEERLAKIDPKTFWTVVKTHCKLDSEACNIACRLQKLPASGSSIERCFSTMSSIMTKTRNRLGIEKAGKLCTIYQSLRFLPDEEYM